MENLPQKQQDAAGFGSVAGFEFMQRAAKLLAGSSMVPESYRASKSAEALSNCVIALELANRIGASPMLVMQNLYIVHGTPAWSSKFLIATINTCGRYSSLRYEWGEDNKSCRAWAIERETGERLNGTWVTWAMVQSEGWNKKAGSKWLTMPDQMFMYRAAAFCQRAYCPELSMGMMTADEAHDIREVDVTPAPATKTRTAPGLSGLKAALKQRAEALDAALSEIEEPAPEFDIMETVNPETGEIVAE